MSHETYTDLNQNTLIGFTDKRGLAWHYKASEQGDEPNHYPMAVPIEDVRRRLFPWEAIEGTVTATGLTSEGVLTIEDKAHKAIMRSDTGAVLGILGAGYDIHQYSESLLAAVESILDDDLSIGSAGLLRGGAVAWVSVEVPDTIETPEGVKFRPNLLAATSHDGSLSTTYQRVVTNVVCDNTMSAALNERGQRIRVRHTRSSSLKLAAARDALQIVHTIADDFAAQVARLTAVKITAPQWASFVEVMAPRPEETGRGQTMADNKRETLNRLWTSDERVAPWAGTAYGVVQAMNTYAHHETSARGGSRADRNTLRAVTGQVDALDRGTLNILDKVLA